MSGQGPQKAVIKPKDGGPALTCGFNPREVSISKSANWQKTAARGAKTAPTPEFTGTDPRQLQMELFFDAWETKSRNVTADVELLFSWTNPTPKSISDGQPTPTVVVFHWGTA